MYSFENDNLSIIPMDFNVFFCSAKKYKKNIRYSKECVVSEMFFDELESFISESHKENISIDMKNVVSCPKHLFRRINVYNKKLIFFNVESENVKQLLIEEIEKLTWVRDTVACYFDKDNYTVEKLVDTECITARKKEEYKIIKSVVDNGNGHIQLLDSSGLYSNCYVDVKKLFIDVEKYYFIIFSLAEQLYNFEGHIDAFISSSKNGAILANILGGLLDVKEVHLIGVGPKYSMELGDSVECIKEGKRYVYIFDFMCTGTELKIVSALINSKKAYLPYAAGIAKYKKDADFHLLSKLVVLADTKDMGIDYKIAGAKEDITKKKR